MRHFPGVSAGVRKSEIFRKPERMRQALQGMKSQYKLQNHLS
jgi:hypothetical protein